MASGESARIVDEDQLGGPTDGYTRLAESPMFRASRQMLGLLKLGWCLNSLSRDFYNVFGLGSDHIQLEFVVQWFGEERVGDRCDGCKYYCFLL